MRPNTGSSTVDVGDVLRGHEVVTAEQWKGRSPRRWFRGAVAGLLAVVTGAGGAVFHSTPAQADPLLFVSINVPISVTAVFGGSGIDRAELEAAKRQIIIAINEATNEIQDHLERLEIATLTACVNATIIDLDASGDFPIDPRIDFAQEATRCAIRIHEQMKVVQNLQHVNSLGYLSLVAFPAAMAARAQAGLPNDEFVVSYIQALELTIERQRPACYYERPQDRPDYLRYYCYALDGTYAQYQQRADRGPIPEEVQEAVRAYATRNISRAAAVAVLPEMQRLLPKLRRGFVFGSVLSGQVSEWNTQGPHFWNQIGNPGNARSVTALATALDIRDNTRHIVAVVDGEVRHRLRRQDGGLTSWSDPGSLGHPGTATAVTAAANQQGETHVVAVIDGQIQHRLRFANGQWTPWALLGNPGTATAVAGTVDPSGGLHMVAVLDGQTHHRTRNADGSWTPWGSIGHAGNATAVASLFDPQGIVQVAAIVDGKFYHRGRYPAGWWSDWSSPGANPSFATAVAGAIDPDGNAQFAIVDDDRVYQRTRFPDSWTPAWNPVEFFPFDSFGTTAVAAS